ncbi:unnamed protein product [marine sediment metagenome]|uniref:Uncharacterized protein n=1 Tax=marine sediment metagenome TaxID=412755 RepID=X1TYL2_9ZZZZ
MHIKMSKVKKKRKKKLRISEEEDDFLEWALLINVDKVGSQTH